MMTVRRMALEQGRGAGLRALNVLTLSVDCCDLREEQPIQSSSCKLEMIFNSSTTAIMNLFIRVLEKFPHFTGVLVRRPRTSTFVSRRI